MSNSDDLGMLDCPEVLNDSPPYARAGHAVRKREASECD